MAEPGRGRTAWAADDETSLQVTGNLRISRLEADPNRLRPLALAFTSGVTVILDPPVLAASEDPSGAAGASFAALMGADPNIDVFVYRVREETVSRSATRGGLCGGLPAKALAISEYMDRGGVWTLRIVSFHGEAQPGLSTGDAGFCRAFRYRAG
jgi:hypothetical protein